MTKGRVHVIDDLIVIWDGKQEYYIRRNGGLLDASRIKTKFNNKRYLSLDEIRKLYVSMVKYKPYTQKEFYFDENGRLLLK